MLLEEDDTETIEAAKRSRPREYVRILVVPRGEPQTKPRACNYGLTFARGEYVVIYDAEDRPDPGQLRAAIDAFRQDAFERRYLAPDRRPLICVQAALNYFNADQNVLTRLFAIEYTHWFDSMLPGLDRSGIPLPLGGTSNHFDTRLLRLVGAWDPWNVTEDADLGLRAAVEGYRVGVINSTTWEEACSQVPAWIKQRTRWIKGYMVTAAVNTRNTVRYVKRTGVAGAVGFLGLIPLVLGFTIVTYVGYNFVGLVLPEWLLAGGVVSMLFGNAMMILVSGTATWRRHGWRIAIFALLNPAYWVLHAVAAWRAAWQMLSSPHKWEKTPHGLDEEYHDDGRWSAWARTFPCWTPQPWSFRSWTRGASATWGRSWTAPPGRTPSWAPTWSCCRTGWPRSATPSAAATGTPPWTGHSASRSRPPWWAPCSWRRSPRPWRRWSSGATGQPRNRCSMCWHPPSPPS
ncbi:glycosyltransferase involved in cell wall biosynthesis [Arthrobacter sp. SLBN-112]|nr:glycosyltransferase involved in cell wall biosynthesis [Arthrobacter sp. SLBN-112]